MGWIKTKDIPEEVKPVPPYTVSVNKWSGLRLNAEVFKAMGSPKWVEVEYNEEQKSLRFKPGSNIVSNEVVNQVVKVPLLVRSEMSHQLTRTAATTRWLVEPNEDGWWYTTRPAK